MRRAQHESRLAALAAAVPPEPSPGAKDVCTLQLRWPDGSRTTRRFAGDTPLRVVHDFALAQNRFDAEDVLCLATNYPRRVLDDELDATLADLKLLPNAVLFCDVKD